MDAKSRLRRELRAKRKALSADERRRAEQRVLRLLKGYLKRGRRLAVYWPVGSELRLDGLAAAARRRKTELYLPYIEAGSLRLWFTPYAAGAAPERRRARQRVQIPQFAGRKIRAHRLHAVVIPLVGTDARGFRLGQGGGYYDVSLSACAGRLQPLKIGVGFACQQVEALPAEPHDIRLDHWVCETGIRRFRR